MPLDNLFRFVKLKSVIAGQELTVTCSGHENEEIHQRPMLEQFGFASVPPVNSDGIALFPNGYTENAVVTFLDSPSDKPTLASGESAIYDKFGNKIVLKSGVVTITAVQNLTVQVSGACNINVTGNCTITAPQTTVNGNLVVNGNVNVNGSIGATGDCNLGGSGGQPIARVGDSVVVDNRTGVITSGSNKSRSN